MINGPASPRVLEDTDDSVQYTSPRRVDLTYQCLSVEILAGAVKDYGRAVIVGDDHTGKGTVKNIVSLHPGLERSR